MYTYNIQYKNQALDVEIEIAPAEPDVGMFGNGKVAIAVLQVTNSAGEEVTEDYTPLEIDDIAHEIYELLGEQE